MSIKERPILFTGAMVRALLDGSKTQTRRIVKWRNVAHGLNLGFSGLGVSETPAGWVLESPTRTSNEWRCDPTSCPYGQPGEQLWVRETWAHDAKSPEQCRAALEDALGGGGYGPYYQATECAPDTLHWRPSIHMPRWASRITLEITGVRVERPKDISEADALAEGVDMAQKVTMPMFPGSPCTVTIKPRSAIEAYAVLWESINGPGSWHENPFVWVVEVKRVKPCPT